MIVVVTGASGYIGGQISILLREAGHKVLGIDRRSLPAHLDKQRLFYKFLQADFASKEALNEIVSFKPDAVIHCAGTSLVGPSMYYPSEYWDNNTVKTQQMLTILQQSLPKTRVIFSSSAAVYGEPVMVPCSEDDPKDPLSPYGQTKLAVEWMLESYHRAYGLSYVAFRYFNACSADSNARHGQEPGATHIIARVLESVRDNTQFTLNGVNYPTEDGTCVRDYVHVEDIARAHIAALDSMTVPSGTYNLGSSEGLSNRQIITAVTEITGKQVNVQIGQERPGDPAVLTADASKFDKLVPGWRQHGLKDIIAHAWKWYS